MRPRLTRTVTPPSLGRSDRLAGLAERKEKAQPTLVNLVTLRHLYATEVGRRTGQTANEVRDGRSAAKSPQAREPPLPRAEYLQSGTAKKYRPYVPGLPGKRTVSSKNPPELGPATQVNSF